MACKNFREMNRRDNVAENLFGRQRSVVTLLYDLSFIYYK